MLFLFGFCHVKEWKKKTVWQVIMRDLEFWKLNFWWAPFDYGIESCTCRTIWVFFYHRKKSIYHGNKSLYLNPPLVEIWHKFPRSGFDITTFPKKKGICQIIQRVLWLIQFDFWILWMHFSCHIISFSTTQSHCFFLYFRKLSQV